MEKTCLLALQLCQKKKTKTKKKTNKQAQAAICCLNTARSS